MPLSLKREGGGGGGGGAHDLKHSHTQNSILLTKHIK